MFKAQSSQSSPEDYASIFARRGREYNRGMMRYPRARAREFAAAISALNPAPGATILDAPAGGGYLYAFLPGELGLTVLEVDPAPEFRPVDQRRSAATDPVARRQSTIAPLDAMPIDSHACDAVVSVAGLHHAKDLRAIFREFRRVLRSGGTLVVMEVDAGSPVDRFLNGFVDEHNSCGHRGEFVGDDFVACIRDAGFTVDRDQIERYSWDFPDRSAMTEFARLVFGLDLADNATILRGIDETLGFTESAQGCAMNWELRLITAF